MALPFRQLSLLSVCLFGLPALASGQANYLDVWSTQIGSAAFDSVVDCAPGPQESLYIGGYSTGDLFGPSLGDNDGYIARLDDTGSVLWSQPLATPENDIVIGVAEDGVGGVFVAGRTEGNLGGTVNGGPDAFVALYDSSGTQVWIQQFGSSNLDAATEVLNDGSGGVFVVAGTLGDLAGPNAGGFDFVLRHIDASGTVLWTQQYGTSGSDSVDGIAADGSGGLYLSGTTDGDLGGPAFGAQDAFLLRYDGLGNQLWGTQIGSSGTDSANDIVVLGPNEIYVAGVTSGDLYGPPRSFLSGFVARFDDNGSELWGSRPGSPEVHAVISLVPAPGGGVLALGTEAAFLGGINLGPGEAFLTRFDELGLQGTTQYFGTAESESTGCMVQGSAGALFITGRTEGDFAAVNAGDWDTFMMRIEPQVGAEYCGPAAPNSSGLPARILATGSTLVSDNTLRLQVLSMPTQQFGYFLNSMAQGFTPNAGGSQGTLCLGGAIGRYIAPGLVQFSGADGRIDLELDLTQTPTPMGTVSVLSGQTWNFQAWFRDVNPLPTSNFTNGVTVNF